MTRPLLVAILTLFLLGTWGGLSLAGEAYNLRKAYNLDKAEQGFAEPAKREEPNASVVAVDAILGRPLGLATTIGGAGVFVATLPFSLPSKSVDTAAWGLVGRPGGWTFVRPLGRSEPRFEEKSIFK